MILKDNIKEIMTEWEQEDKKLKKEKVNDERLEKLRAQASAARAAKAAKREARLKAQEKGGNELSGLSAALLEPRQLYEHGELLNRLSVMQARALYDELKKIFGG